jgi:hypothetical protein
VAAGSKTAISAGTCRLGAERAIRAVGVNNAEQHEALKQTLLRLLDIRKFSRKSSPC